MDETTCGHLEPEQFKVILREYPELKLFFKKHIDNYRDPQSKFNQIMMRNVPGLRLASRDTIKAITQKLNDIKVFAGDKILRMGEINDKCFFIRDGEVDVIARSVSDPDKAPQVLCRLSKGAYFNVVNSFMGRPSLFDFVAADDN